MPGWCNLLRRVIPPRPLGRAGSNGLRLEHRRRGDAFRIPIGHQAARPVDIPIDPFKQHNPALERSRLLERSGSSLEFETLDWPRWDGFAWLYSNYRRVCLRTTKCGRSGASG